MQSCTYASVECRLTRPEGQLPPELSHGLASGSWQEVCCPSTGMTTPPREPIFCHYLNPSILDCRTNHARKVVWKVECGSILGLEIRMGSTCH